MARLTNSLTNSLTNTNLGEEEEEPNSVLDLKDILAEQNPEVEKEDLNIVPVKPEEAPEEVIFPAPTPDIKTRIYTNYLFLKEFTDEDFNTEQPTLIDLKRENLKKEKINDGFWFIVFIDETQIGRQFLQLWLELAQIVKVDYLNLGYCNLTFQKNIFNAFKELGKIENIDHPFAWSKFVEIPFMLTFRNHWPQGFYNGPIGQQSLVNYIMDEASDPLVILDKKHPRRLNFQNQIFESEKRLVAEDLKEKAKKEDEKRKEELKNIDPRTQEITDGNINFFD